MVINETKRAFTYLCLYDLTVECLIVNRVIPESDQCYFERKLDEQQKYMQIINESFSPLKVLKAYQLPVELVGMASLEKLGDMVFGDLDPTTRFSIDKPIAMEESDYHFELPDTTYQPDKTIMQRQRIVALLLHQEHRFGFGRYQQVEKAGGDSRPVAGGRSAVRRSQHGIATWE